MNPGTGMSLLSTDTVHVSGTVCLAISSTWSYVIHICPSLYLSNSLDNYPRFSHVNFL